jgi:SAM-dependent methyltransferase
MTDHLSTDLETAHAARFDLVSRDYVEHLNKNLRLTGSTSDHFYRAKIQMIRERLSATPKVILDFGCGIGILSRILAESFPDSKILGFDPSAESIRVGKENSVGFGDRLELHSELSEIEGQADLVVSAGVFHHIHSDFQQKNFKALFDAMAAGGKLFVFEHNPWSPLARLIVALANVDRGACLISGPKMRQYFEQAAFSDITVDYISFFPPWMGPFLKLETYLKKFPLGAQYLAMGEKRHR